MAEGFDPSVDSGPVNQPVQQTTPASGGNNDWLKQLAAALAAAGGGLAGRAIANHSGNPLTQAVPPQLSQLLDNSVARQGYQNPLFQATTKGVYDMLPAFAKDGTSLSGSLPSTIPPSAASASGSGGGPGLGTALGAGGLAALAGLLGKNGSGGAIPLQKIIDGLKKLFQNHRTVQGNKPNQGGALTGPGFDNTFTGWNDPGMNYDQWPGSGNGNPNVTTDINFSYPNDVFNDPYFLNSMWNGSPSDPSGGSGVGPGMQNYYNGNWPVSGDVSDE